MQDLFSAKEAALSPLADRMRPRTLDEFIGQGHIVGPGRLLRRAIEADRMTSSIFYGPPGCGKTTLASIIANTTHSAFVQLNAVTSGVADVRQVIKEAQDRRSLYGRHTCCWTNATDGANRRATASFPPSSAAWCASSARRRKTRSCP